MRRIVILPQYEAQKIAAGEVVERPASVVKELLENALDAGATEISIAIHDGGKRRISITDNGCGMSSEDTFLCVEHHATSKIRSVDELADLNTFGFRGEALSSIASVSTMRITTRQAPGECGLELIIRYGECNAGRMVAASIGTTIVIEDLFVNVPARRKFLKQRDTEWRAIQQLVTAYALALPTIGFTLYHEDNLVFTVPVVTTMLERSQSLFPVDIATHLVPVVHQSGAIRIDGVITNHQVARYDRKLMFSFVNQRWVKNHIFGKAIIAGYSGMLPPNKYPVAALRIEIPKDQVDINVHPRKEEVLLMHPHVLSNALEKAIETALSRRVTQLIESAQNETVLIQKNAHMNNTHLPDQRPVAHYDNVFDALVIPTKHQERVTYQPEQVFVDRESDAFVQTPLSHQPLPEPVVVKQQCIVNEHISYEVIGQLHATYILMESAEGLMILDQHAAHEAILYNQLQDRSHHVSTVLLFPECIRLNTEDQVYMNNILELLRDIGIVADAWNDTHIMVTGSPVVLHNIPLADMVYVMSNTMRDMQLAALHKDEHVAYKQKIYHALYAMAACKKAVKAGDVLNMDEMKNLINAFMKTSQRLHCPHGRPTNWLIGKRDLETWFQRK